MYNNQNELHILRSYLKYGDIKKIAACSGFHYITVINMLKGRYKMHPLVFEALNKIVEERRRHIDDEIKHTIL